MKNHRNISKWLQAGLVLCAIVALAFLAKHYEYPDIQVNYVEENCDTVGRRGI